MAAPLRSILALAGLTLAGGLSVAETPRAGTWADARAALEGMPLPASPALGRSNAIRLILQSFKPHPAVRTLVVLPGAIDDFHLVHRHVPLAAVPARSLAGVLESLTNLTSWRLTFDPERARLLVHTAADRVIPEIKFEAPGLSARLQERRSRAKPRWIDATWSGVHPALEQALGHWVQPPPASEAAGHFERVNLAGQGLSVLELVEAVALASGSRAVVGRREIRFER